MSQNDRFRMFVWLIVGLALYSLAQVAGVDRPAVQTVLWKLGHVTTLAWVGYWISRQAIGRVGSASAPVDRLARAVVIAGVIVAGSLGL